MELLIYVAILLFVLGSALADGESTYATCGQENSDDVNGVINATVERLMELRHPTWGWTNTPEVVLGLQLSAQEQFFGRNKTIAQMEMEVKNDLESMNIGKLALYVLAVKASCEDPRNFAGKNLVKILDRRSRKQFRYNGSIHIIPLDRYYRFGLTVGALCVSRRRARNWIIRKVLKGQQTDGSFGDVHSVDDAAQVLLALKCVETENRPRYLKRLIKTAITKLVLFLRSKITSDGDDVWIGNKYSSPSSALALMEEDEESPEEWKCEEIMDSLAVNPEPLEQEGGFSQRLPALAGDSYISLKTTEWECETPAPIPVGYQPTCNPCVPSTCNPVVVTTSPQTMINVRLTIYTNPPPSVGDVPNADVTVNIQNGSTLYVAMVKARDDGMITFVSKTSAWGESIKSMQGIEADAAAHEYWALIDAATQNLLPKGVSSYIPDDGEQIDFRLRTW